MPFPYPDYRDPASITSEELEQMEAKDPLNQLQQQAVEQLSQPREVYGPPGPGEVEMGSQTAQQAAPGASASPQQPAPPDQAAMPPAGAQPSASDAGVGQTALGEGLAGGLYGIAQDPRTAAEVALAAPSGLIDFGVDLLNLIPGVEIPKIPAFRSEEIQSIREVVSIVGPTVGGIGLATKAAQTANAAVKWKLGQDALFSLFAKAGLSGGVGAAVDYVNKINQKDDNLAGYLKKSWPKAFGWISDDWATVDGDSPDVLREKNVKEGVGIGWVVDSAEIVAKLLRGITGTKNLTKWIPKDETAEAYFKKIEDFKKVHGESPDEVTAAYLKNEEALDDLGEYRASKGTLDEPVLGIHDMFDDVEQGIRTLDDMGALGALGDAARIQNNIQTSYGRMRNFISEGALKFGLKADNLQKREIVNMVRRNIEEAGEFDYLVGNKLLTQKEMKEAGEVLAREWFDARLDVEQMKEALAPFQFTGQGNITELTDAGVAGVTELMRKYLDEYVSLDSMKAAGLAAAQKAGQLADTAEGIRLMEGTAAIERGQEQILDIMEFLMVERGVSTYMRGRGLAMLDMWRAARNDIKAQNAAEAKLLNDQANALKDIMGNAKNTADQLREISKERPEFLVPLQMAWEFTDGKVDTLGKLNKYIEESLPNIQKAFYDGNPEVPNVIVQGAWGNIYNSMLSGASFVKAFFGNAAILLSKPVAIMAGAAMRGDMDTVKRAWHMYSAFGDNLQKGAKHMGLVFRKASQDPKSVSYIIRDDIALKNEAQFDILNSFALAAQKRGEDGPMVLYTMAKQLDDLVNHPVLRGGTNALTAVDGFQKAILANADARFLAYENYVKNGQELTDEVLEEINQKLYNDMFDSSGMITDQGIEYASKEIAMNLDNAAAKGISGYLRQFPILRPFMMFPRTSFNMIGMVDKFSPVSLFMQDYNKLAMKPRNAFSADEIREILVSKGIPFDEYAHARFDMLRAEALGRKAIGTTLITMSGYLFMSDRLTGDGFFDNERQKTREGLGWKPRSFKGLDNKWYSYDGFGPVSDWIAVVATAMDHFDTLDPVDLETFLHKSAYVLGTALTGKTPLAGLEPMFDILSGNAAAAARWAASFSNSMLPLGGARNVLGKALVGPMKELDMDYMQLMRNRNNYFDVIDPGGALPDKNSWIDGEPITGGENFFARVWNATMPMKVSNSLSKVGEFLMEVEYDSRPTFMKSKDGVDLTPKERSELYALMGKQGYFKREVERIMKQPFAQNFRNEVRKARKDGRKVDVEKFAQVHAQLDIALREARTLAEASISNRDELIRRAYEQRLGVYANQKGRGFSDDLSEILEFAR